MGLLDDAIKEHLELKRRRGADAAEISQLEREALSPVARSADGVPDLPDTFEPPADDEVPSSAAGAPPVASPPAAAYEPPAYEPPPAPAYEPPLVPQPPSDLSSVTPPPAHKAWMIDPDPEPDVAPEPETEPRDFAPEPESSGLLSRFRPGRRSKREPEPEPEPAPPEPSALAPLAPLAPASASEPPPPPPPPPPSYAAAPPPVQHEPDIAPADDEPEDLLEETPEFLEETPEHDRLWFEQRPPRDFDFDG